METPRLGALRRLATLAAPSLFTSGLSLGAVLVREGWPLNHERLAFAFRTHVYASHLVRGDVLPIWSSEDSYGMGSPFPLFYHKLFYWVTGVSQAIGGDMKASVVAAIFLFLLVGCAGLFRAARRLGASPGIASLVAATLPLQHYTIFDWLVRGAMAEFAAAMLAPWLFHAALVLVQDRRVSIGIPASLAAMALAHSVLAYYASFVVIAAWAIAMLGSNGRTRVAITARLAMSVLAVMALFAPYFAVFVKLRVTYGVGRTLAGLDPHGQMLNPWSYLSPLPWIWEDWRGVYPQTSPVTLAFLLGAALVVARHWTATRRGRSLYGRDGWGSGLLLAVVGAFFAFLQLRPAAWIYDLVPGFDFLQFPWRLLALLQVIALLVIARGFARWRGRAAGALAGTFLLLSVAATKSLLPIRYRWFTAEELAARAPPGRYDDMFGIGEYVPGIVSRDGGRPKFRFHRQPEVLSGDATTFTAQRERFEQMDLEYAVLCGTDSLVALPLFWSGLERITVSTVGESERVVAAERTDPDPRIRIRLPSGNHTIRVELPTMSRALGFVR